MPCSGVEASAGPDTQPVGREGSSCFDAVMLGESGKPVFEGRAKGTVEDLEKRCIYLNRPD